MSMKDAIAEVEAKLAELAAKIEAGNKAAAPARKKLDKLLAKEQELKADIDAAVAELNAARGDGHAWLALKRQYGQLAATRMQMRAAAKVL